MELAVQMETNRVRELEAKASVMKAQLDHDAQMLQLAQKDEAERARILASLRTAESKAQTERFIAGTDTALKVRDQKLKQDELKYKRDTGKPGI